MTWLGVDIRTECSYVDPMSLDNITLGSTPARTSQQSTRTADASSDTSADASSDTSSDASVVDMPAVDTVHLRLEGRRHGHYFTVMNTARKSAGAQFRQGLVALRGPRGAHYVLVRNATLNWWSLVAQRGHSYHVAMLNGRSV